MQRLFDFCKRVLLWVLEFLREFLFLEFPVALIGVTHCVTRDFRSTSAIAGFTLQAFGSLLIIRELISRPRVFGLPSLLNRFTAWHHDWLARTPRWHRDEVVDASAALRASFGGSTSRVIVTSTSAAGTSLEARVAAVEHELAKLLDQVREDKVQFRMETSALRALVAASKTDFESGMKKLEEMVESLALGHVVDEFTGAFWLLLGLVIGFFALVSGSA
jgi:hypothetical protein